MDVQTFSGDAVAPHLDAVAALRIAVFRDWPYLYDGDAAYEAKYLATYARSPRSLFVLAFDGGRVVGASTAIPLADETDAFRAPFLERGIEPERVYYFGESVLLCTTSASRCCCTPTAAAVSATASSTSARRRRSVWAASA